MGRKFLTLDQYAERSGFNLRTIRNYIGEGLVTGYRLPGAKGVVVDVDEADAALAAAGKSPRSKYGQFGPKAKIVDLSRAVAPVEFEGEADR